MWDPCIGDGDPGWIDCGQIDDFLTREASLIIAVDGSDCSMLGLEWGTNDLMQSDRATKVTVVHIYDDGKEGYLPPQMRKDSLRAVCDAKLTGSLISQRFSLRFVPKDKHIGMQLVEEIERWRADFIVLGFWGRKGPKKSSHLLASNTLEVMQRGHASCIVMQNEDLHELPAGRTTKFVVSVSLNAAATKAFVDALRLSKPGDEIHVIYIKSYLERTESDYTLALRRKYAAFFSGLLDGGVEDPTGPSMAQEVLAKFCGRSCIFKMIPKQLHELTPCAVVRYANEIDADFLVVGTNRLRVDRGKPHLGSVSLQICMETQRNFIVSNYSSASLEKRAGVAVQPFD